MRRQPFRAGWWLGVAGKGGSCVANVSAVITKGQNPVPQPALPDSLATKLDKAAASSFKAAAAPGAIVGVSTPQGTWTHVYGVADPATGAPMTSDMHMRIGSVTKTFTGTLILQLAQDGKLSLSDTIDKYVTGIPNGNRITLAMLANMTSGVASYYTKPFLQRYFGDPSTVFPPDELVGYGVAASPVFSADFHAADLAFGQAYWRRSLRPCHQGTMVSVGRPDWRRTGE